MTAIRLSACLTLILSASVGCDRPPPTPAEQKLTVGIGKDSVFQLMKMKKARRIDPYLVNGQYIEAMMFPALADTGVKVLEDRAMFPVVVVNAKVAGWGWTFWDSVAAANKISVARDTAPGATR